MNRANSGLQLVLLGLVECNLSVTKEQPQDSLLFSSSRVYTSSRKVGGETREKWTYWRKDWHTKRKWGRVISISFLWCWFCVSFLQECTISLHSNFLGTYFSRRLILSVEWGLPWVCFQLFLFIWHHLRLRRGLRSIPLSVEGWKKLPDFQLFALPPWASCTIPGTSPSIQQRKGKCIFLVFPTLGQIQRPMWEKTDS